MKSRFEPRFEEQLQKTDHSLLRKGGIKKAQKVYERIGRAKERYPFVQTYY